jgi:plastocyanin
MVEILTRRRAPLVGVFVLSLLLQLAGCTSSGSTSLNGAPGAAEPLTPAASAGAPASMTISNFTFSSASAAPGETVSVINEDGVDHTVTIADVGIDVRVPANGRATFTAPDAPGTYRVTCDFHANMKGGLTVTQ